MRVKVKVNVFIKEQGAVVYLVELQGKIDLRSCPLLLIGLGELVVERSSEIVLNKGLEHDSAYHVRKVSVQV